MEREFSSRTSYTTIKRPGEEGKIEGTETKKRSVDSSILHPCSCCFCKNHFFYTVQLCINAKRQYITTINIQLINKERHAHDDFGRVVEFASLVSVGCCLGFIALVLATMATTITGWTRQCLLDWPVECNREFEGLLDESNRRTTDSQTHTLALGNDSNVS